MGKNKSFTFLGEVIAKKMLLPQELILEGFNGYFFPMKMNISSVSEKGEPIECNFAWAIGSGAQNKISGTSMTLDLSGVSVGTQVSMSVQSKNDKTLVYNLTSEVEPPVVKLGLEIGKDANTMKTLAQTYPILNAIATGTNTSYITGATTYLSTGIAHNANNSIAYDLDVMYEANGIRRLTGWSDMSGGYFGAKATNVYEGLLPAQSVGNRDRIHVESSASGFWSTINGGDRYVMPSAVRRDGNLTLFTIGNQVANYANMNGVRLYSAKIYENGELKRFYIPVQQGTTACLLELVSETLVSPTLGLFSYVE